jgi:hypothetical protein
MDDHVKAKMEVDQAKGESYQRAWEFIIEPFFDAKQLELYEAFFNMPTSNKEALVDIKLQVNSLMSLKDEIEHYINTGKLAKTALEGESNGD